MYSPGLPFIEQYLPADQFLVTHQVVAGYKNPEGNPDKKAEVVRVTRLTG